MKAEIRALYADEDGAIFDAPGIAGLGRSGNTLLPLAPADLIPLPESADLMFLPDRAAMGMTAAGETLPLAGRAVAAILPAGYTRLLLPAFQREEGARPLRLHGGRALQGRSLCGGSLYG